MDDIIHNLDDIQKFSQDQADEFEVMYYLLQIDDELDDKKLDKLVDTVAKEVIKQIDCTACGNCCRNLPVYLTKEDVEQLDETISEFSEKNVLLIDYDTHEVGEWARFRNRPCAFLKGKLCTTYMKRPETCRTYPVFTPDFRWSLGDIIAGAGICPIIYNVLSRMVQISDDISSGNIDIHLQHLNIE